MYINKILAVTHIRTLAFAVITPVVALSGVFGYIIADQKRSAVEQTVVQAVHSTVHATERELTKHLAAAELLAAMINLDRLDAFTLRLDEVMTLRRDDWLNVVIMDHTHHVYNFARQLRGEPPLRSLNPELTRDVLTTGRRNISPVMTSDRYPEPFIAIRVPIAVPGTDQLTHVLTVVVRAWALTLATKTVYAPENWRIGILDEAGSIVGRSTATDWYDVYIGRVTPLKDVPPDKGLVLTETLDGTSLYTSRVMLALPSGWSATVGVPQDEIDGAVESIIYTLSVVVVVTIAIAVLLGFVLVHAYARVRTTEALQNSLSEKETLLREVHHRVKNNMQGTMGILLFERSRVTDPYAKERLRVISDRISIQGRIHQHLYEQGDLHRIEIGTFLAELCHSILASSCQDPCGIRLTTSTDKLYCDIDVAMPLGLITNELMTNAIKHGFRGHDRGEIMVGLERRDKSVVLTVSDNGVGCLDGGESMHGTVTQKQGIGTTLINLLSRQIDAEFKMTQDVEGTLAWVVVPSDAFV